MIGSTLITPATLFVICSLLKARLVNLLLLKVLPMKALKLPCNA